MLFVSLASRPTDQPRFVPCFKILVSQRGTFICHFNYTHCVFPYNFHSHFIAELSPSKSANLKPISYALAKRKMNNECVARGETECEYQQQQQQKCGLQCVLEILTGPS